MAELPARLPSPLSQRLATASAALYARQGREFDVAIGGIPFMLATTPDVPEAIETIKVRKEQFDTEDPGEQSLTGWWRRSQASWHGGAGVRYQESNADNAESVAFFDSAGVDVWTPGQITLLKKMEARVSASNTRIRASVRDSAGTTWLTTIDASGDLVRYEGLETDSVSGIVQNEVNALVDGLVSSNHFYSIATDGTFYEGTPVTGTPTTTSWPLTGAAPKRIEWGLHRPWVISDREIWQPDLSDAGSTAQVPVYTHPNKGWTYTCLAEAPSGMLFGGHDGQVSSIQIITLDSTGGVPALSGAIMACRLPAGELIHEISVMAGSFIGIGTNRGFRVGAINGAQISYGPLLFEPDGVTACTAIANHGRFFYVAFDATETCVYRVDTSVQIAEGVFAYAKDADTGSTLNSIVVADGRVFGTDTLNVWHQSATKYVPTGWLESGRIRYRTTTEKSFKFIELGIEPLNGAIAVSLIQEDGSSNPVGSITAQGSVFDERFALNSPLMRHASIRVTLTPTGDELGTPIINSYLLLALPAVPPQRLIIVPLLCFDYEEARSGQRYGGSGWAADRLQALHILEDGAETLTYQDFGFLEGGVTVVIESLRFVKTSPPSPHRSTGPGGILIAELRTVDL